ncbi:MAG TPA: hypothetical protein VHD60_01680 [Candidatus Saccharimonadales bacterium]|nr:hypothetical protein [Candidatus Saccharimonadales bacterium]
MTEVAPSTPETPQDPGLEQLRGLLDQAEAQMAEGGVDSNAAAFLSEMAQGIHVHEQHQAGFTIQGTNEYIPGEVTKTYTYTIADPEGKPVTKPIDASTAERLLQFIPQDGTPKEASADDILPGKPDETVSAEPTDEKTARRAAQLKNVQQRAETMKRISAERFEQNKDNPNVNPEALQKQWAEEDAAEAGGGDTNTDSEETRADAEQQAGLSELLAVWSALSESDKATLLNLLGSVRAGKTTIADIAAQGEASAPADATSQEAKVSGHTSKKTKSKFPTLRSQESIDKLLASSRTSKEEAQLRAEYEEQWGKPKEVKEKAKESGSTLRSQEKIDALFKELTSEEEAQLRAEYEAQNPTTTEEAERRYLAKRRWLASRLGRLLLGEDVMIVPAATQSGAMAEVVPLRAEAKTDAEKAA